MNEKDMHELNLDELDLVNGGTKLMWQALYLIFNGTEGFDDMKINESFGLRYNLAKKIEKITGVKIDFNPTFYAEKEIEFKMSDGTIMNEDEFLDYLKATYSMDEVLSWHTM